MRHFFLFLAFLVGILIPNALPAQSDCGCDSKMTLDDHKDAANVIFVGHCLRVSTNPIKGGLNVLFQVDSSWKRGIEHSATVHTNSVGQCGFGFEEGEDYLVFASKRHQTIGTSMCQPNLLADDAAEVIASLGRGNAPGRPEMAQNMNLLIFALGLGGLLFMAFIVLRKKVFKSASS